MMSMATFLVFLLVSFKARRISGSNFWTIWTTSSMFSEVYSILERIVNIQLNFPNLELL